MERFTVSGGNRLYGAVRINAAKNSVLPLISASILSEGKTYIKNCPKISDVFVMTEIIKSIGGKAFFDGDTLVLDASTVCDWKLPEELTKRIRASFFTVGALLSRFEKAGVYSPGGCNIGKRPIDIHISALKTLGVSVSESDYISFKVNRRDGGKVTLKFPSVGATENVILASVRRKGEVRIVNCAREPEIVDLQEYLNLLGYKVNGAGTDEIVIEGVEKPSARDVEFTPSPDRIEAGTFLLAGAMCGGEIEFRREYLKNSLNITKILGNNACKIIGKNDKIYIIRFTGRTKAFGKVVTGPYPEFVTDMQPQLAACACVADGVTVIEEKVFPERFAYVSELKKTGADIEVFGNACVIVGKKNIGGAVMSAGDLRGGAALLLAGLAAEGRSVICGVSHIDRGYERIDEKLRALGADIVRAEI